ncbi:hypothetical protein CC80DRAFT_579789 [Byssothecium circinans]|uniref:Uncharacterized protein n=1 Tax=Byssothecium circinans TaxID=147558 RepID=A0A6A5TFT3_9PLEO|nr:hypothetical protein CC80DRAFT_579789 [Byssothecium circinans]
MPPRAITTAATAASDTILSGKAIAADLWQYLDLEATNKPSLEPLPQPTGNESNARAIIWKERRKEYTIKYKLLSDLGNYMLNTIETTLYGQLANHPKVAEKLEILHTMFNRTQAVKVNEARNEYNNCKKKTVGRDTFKDWSHEFQLALNKAKELKLLKVDGFQP